MNALPHTPTVAIIGGGPAGLMAAEVLCGHGLHIDLYEAMPTVGRKFLYAGKSGLNLSHAEPFETFITRYGARQAELEPMLATFGAEQLRHWAHDLGIETFVGSSGRIFPTGMKAAPLLRAWLSRLRQAGVKIHPRHRWLGWDDSGALRFATEEGEKGLKTDATVFALGGGSWARLGSDGSWTTLFAARGIAIAPLRPANCGFLVDWSEHFHERFAGEPVKAVALACRDEKGERHSRRGEFVISRDGVEGGLIYALSALLRDTLERDGIAQPELDLLPDWSAERVLNALSKPRGGKSMANHLRRRLGIEGVKAGLLRECLGAETFADTGRLAAAIKAVPLRLRATRPIDEAISTAGGIPFEALDERLMVKSLPGHFCAGEMLDWEAPTGGYLLTACFASGRIAGLGALQWLNSQRQQKA